MLQLNSKMRPACLTILNMDIVKKRIDKYFGADYLIVERSTHSTSRLNASNNDMLLRTIRLTDNLFSLKEKLPESAYSKEEA